MGKTRRTFLYQKNHIFASRKFPLPSVGTPTRIQIGILLIPDSFLIYGKGLWASRTRRYALSDSGRRENSGDFALS
ncbi:hypothetical protein A0128_14520 [Leptospira tipperaryensis]|uniref:Uncharacterized protein n=1 Tax=Leptospira tipperaryensis TaxID=2564040 RepID=A0A1D7UZD7_9LEPT|nr:hypothetical protein A0128_14520 [Leptospira tipperaryensis]